MHRTLTFTLEITDAEVANFLSRLTGADGRSVTTSVTTSVGDDNGNDEGTTNPNAPERDKRGVPWIAGIHASTKSQIADGSWRRSKGVTADQQAAAEAPYLQAQQPAASFQVPASIASPGAPVGAAPVTIPSPPVGMPGMSMPAAPLPPITYDQLSAKYQELSASGKISEQIMVGLYTQCGITPDLLPSLSSNETLMRQLFDKMSAL